MMAGLEKGKVCVHMGLAIRFPRQKTDFLIMTENNKRLKTQASIYGSASMKLSQNVRKA